MADADFTTTDEVYFNGQKIDEVYLGVTKLWPITLKPAIVQRVLNVRSSQLSATIRETDTSWVVPRIVQFQLQAGANSIWLDGMDTSLVDGLFDTASMIISAKQNSDRMFGHNKSQDTAEGPAINGQGRSWQTRYGGQWMLPRFTKPGDVVYINVGNDRNWFTVGKITFT